MDSCVSEGFTAVSAAAASPDVKRLTPKHTLTSHIPHIAAIRRLKSQPTPRREPSWRTSSCLHLQLELRGACASSNQRRVFVCICVIQQQGAAAVFPALSFLRRLFPVGGTSCPDPEFSATLWCLWWNLHSTIEVCVEAELQRGVGLSFDCRPELLNAKTLSSVETWEKAESPETESC